MGFYTVAHTFTPGASGVGGQIFRPNDRDIIIGSERSGAKSANLQKYKSSIEKVPDLKYEPHIAGAPRIYKGYLSQIGASHEKREETIMAIEQTPFSTEALDAHDALRGFLKPGVYYAFRSDECHAGGNGLWEGDFIRLTGNKEKDLGIINYAAKVVLKSEFSANVLAFKQRMGLALEDTPGVFVMEVVADDIWKHLAPADEWLKPSHGPVLLPRHHFNAISAYDGRKEVALVAGGGGIGGANDPWFEDIFSFGSPFPSRVIFSPHGRTVNVLYDDKVDSLSVVAGKINLEESPASDIRAQISMRFRGAVGVLVQSLAAFAGLSGETNYLELVANPSDSLSVLQCAPARPYKYIPRPDVPKDAVVLHSHSISFFGQGACGNLLADTTQVIYLPNDNGGGLAKYEKDLKALNRELRGYVLIAQHHTDSFGMLDFADYSNARAIVFPFVDYQTSSLSSHLSGALREAGIAVIRGRMDEKFMEKLKPGLNEIPLTIFADEARGEALIAER